MAKNDVILLDGIIDQRLAEQLPTNERDEVFEYFVLEEMLKDYDLSQDEIESGWIDGRDDGGFDGLFILINGHLLEDSEESIWPRSNASIEVWLFSCKHHATFQQAPLDKIVATITELLDLSVGNDKLCGSYSEDVLEFRDLLHLAYRKLSIGRPIVKFNVIYASRGETSEVGESVQARASQIKSAISSLFSSCSVQFQFIGARELVAMHRKVKSFSLDLPFMEHLATGKDSYVLLVKLDDYWKFISDDNGHLRRYLFDSNVRDYLGVNQVNEDIARSLQDEHAPDFWWLNNGVTILATHATVPGKTIQLQDIQIVNGLQTTETIFSHFQNGSLISRDRALLVKIIVSTDTQARDRIIRATNNQSPIEVAALHATDKIQRDIEDILEKYDWYYERRKNYYRNIGKPQSRFVTPLYIASAVVALIFKNPARATTMKSKFMRNQSGYDAVFSAGFPLKIWPLLAHIYKQVDASMLKILMKRNKGGERLIRNRRAIISLLVVAKKFGTFSYAVEQLLQIDAASITDSLVQEIWELVVFVSGGMDRAIKVKPSFHYACCEEAVKRYGLAGIEVIGKRGIPVENTVVAAGMEPLSDEFVRKVDELLPEQPWKRGVHLGIASELQCTSAQVHRAINQLIADRRRYMQRDGIVYDVDQTIIAVDPERVQKLTESNGMDVRNV